VSAPGPGGSQPIGEETRALLAGKKERQDLRDQLEKANRDLDGALRECDRLSVLLDALYAMIGAGRRK
jgi:hypothetical protein